MSLLNDASLVLIPSGYKEDKVYSIIPSDGSGDLDFVRGSDGTRINSLGQVDNICWNLLQYSEVFNNAYWNVQDASVSSNSTTAPNGTLTADTFTRNANTGYLYNTPTSLNIGNYTISVYAKANTNSSFRLDLATGGATQGVFCVFDLSNGTASTPTLFGTANNFVATIENVGNGWYRCSLNGNLGTSGSYYSEFALTTGSIYVWGAQLNAGALKPYFPTTDRLNVPRLTYENGCPSLLLEKQSTNLITYSEQFDNAAWNKAQATINSNIGVSPDGTQTADKLIINNGNIGGYTYQAYSTSSGTTYTGSIYLKAAGVNYTTFHTNISGSFQNATIDLTTGVITNNSFAVAPTSQSVGNGWYRISYTLTSGGGTIAIYVDGGSTSSGSSYTGNGIDGIYLWGAQLETSTYPTSYIPTTSATVTRLADSCYKTGISSLIGQTEGTIFLDLYFDNIDQIGGVDTLLILNNGTNNNEISILLDTPAGANKTLLGLITNGGTYQSILYASSPISATRYKIALAYKNNDVAFYINGSLVGTDTSATIPTTSAISFKSRSDNSWLNIQKEYINASALFKRRLTNTELANLTNL